MTTKTYTVSAVIDREDGITTFQVGTYADLIEAMKVAKKFARTRKDCVSYGPSSIAYVGRERTAVVAW